MNQLPEGQKHAPSVVDGKFMRTSVSNVNKYRMCPRAWHFRYVAGIPDKPPGKGAIKGTEGHKRLEHYYKTGQNVLGPLELLGIERGYIEAPDPDHIFSEQAFEFMEGTVKVVGSIDLVHLKVDKGYTLLTDWKFKKNIEEWGSTPEELVDADHDNGVQMMGYVRAVSDLALPSDKVAVRHVTFQTEGRKEAAEAWSDTTVEEGISKWKTVVEKNFPGMTETAKVKESLKVLGNEEACDRYGGCAYKSRCFDPMARFTKAMRGMGEVKTDKVLQSDISAVGVTLTSTETGRNTVGTLDRLMSRDVVSSAEVAVGKAQAARVSSVPEAVVKVEQLAAIDAARALDNKGDPLVLPPDAPQPDPATAFRVPSVPVSPVQENAPKKRGRPPKKAETQGPSVPVSPVQEKAAPATVTADVEVLYAAKAEDMGIPVNPVNPVNPVTSGPSYKGIHLYFGCSPVGVKTKNLLTYVIGLQTRILTALQLDLIDIRTAAGGELGFGKWRAALGKVALSEPPAPGHYVLIGADERAACVAEALAAVLPAGNVVIGGR